MEKENYRIIAVLFGMCFHYLAVCSQNISDFHQMKINPLHNLNWRESNQEQIKPIKNLFKENNIIILAENTHYDGAIRDAECMILKELIDAGTINTIYVESSWLDINKINSILKKGGSTSIEETYQYCGSLILQYWNNTGFWKYLAGKIIEGKVELIGFDIGGAKASIAQNLYKDALSLPGIKNVYKNKDDELNQLNDDYNLFGFKYDLENPYGNYLVQSNFIRTVISEYSRNINPERVKEWRMIESYYEWVYRRQVAVKRTKVMGDFDKYIKEKTGFHSFRDGIMAEIFLAHFKTTKKIKAVAIMSAYHALNNFRNYPEIMKCCVDSSTHVMNERLNKAIPDSIYTICFASGSVTWGHQVDDRKFIYGKIKPDKKSIEHYFREKTTHSWLYTDLKKRISQGVFHLQSSLAKRSALIGQKFIKA